MKESDRMKVLFKVFSVFIVLAVILSIFTGCFSSVKGPESSQGQSSVAILIGKNRLAGTLSLNSKALNDDITNAALNEGKISAVQIEGEPSIIDEEVVKRDTNNPTEGRTKQLANNAINALSLKINESVPVTPEVDVVEGINRAVSTLTSSDAVGNKVLYVLANGFSTTGILNMTQFNLFDSNVELLAQDILPYIADLNGITVKWLDMGNVNTQIQDKPDNKQIEVLKSFYSTVVEAKGGSVEFLNDTGTCAVESESYPEVTPVVIPKNTISPQKIEVKLGEDKLAFEPDTAVLINPDTAKSAIGNISKSIVDSHRQVTLIGSTASWGSESNCLTLAKDRCMVVKQLLLDSGVPESQIDVVAIGRSEKSSLRVNDLNSSGKLIESEGKKNRFVFITSTPEDYL